MGAESNSLAVGLGEIKISRNPTDILVAYGLGSCVGVGVYDPITHVAGLLHAVLPEQLNNAERSAKYVDVGIAELLSSVEKNGGLRGRLTVRLAGGAHMLNAPGFKQTLNIGERNVVAALATLANLNLKIAAQDVGGNLGRTVRLYVANGRLTVRAMGSPERDL
jgi:chemotaxis protein CheD